MQLSVWVSAFDFRFSVLRLPKGAFHFASDDLFLTSYPENFLYICPHVGFTILANGDPLIRAIR